MCEDIKTKLVEYITQNQERFYRLIYSHTSDREATLDIIQNAIVKALEKYDTIQRIEYMET